MRKELMKRIEERDEWVQALQEELLKQQELVTYHQNLAHNPPMPSAMPHLGSIAESIAQPGQAAQASAPTMTPPTTSGAGGCQFFSIAAEDERPHEGE